MYFRRSYRRHSQGGKYLRRLSSFFKIRLNATKITLTFAIVLVLSLFFMDYRHQSLPQSIKMMIVDATLPLIDFSIQTTHKIKHNVRKLLNPYSEYEAQLKEKDEAIHFWKLEIQRLRGELKQFETLLNYKKDLTITAVSAHLYIPQGQSVRLKGFVDVGLKSNTQKDSVVISPQGLIGKIIHVGEKSSEVILLNHPLSAVPVYVERTDQHGVVKGNLKYNMTLDYLTPDQLKDGDRLLTSGQGGIFPRGLNVAVVKKTKGNIQIQPIYDTDHTFFVYILSPIKGEFTDEI